MGYRLRGSTFTVFLDVYKTPDGKMVPVQDKRHREEVHMRNPDVEIKRESAVFAHWNYDLKCQIDMEATTVDSETQLHYINPVKKRRLKLKYLLRDWSLVEDDGTPIKVTIDPMNKCLTEEFYRMNITGPTPIDPVMLDAFIAKADMILEWGMSEEEVNSPNPK